MLADALRRLWARLAGGRSERTGQMPPEVYEIAYRAGVAMTGCTCGHPWIRHEHYHRHTDCDACRCERFRPDQPARAPAARSQAPQLPDALQGPFISMRVAWWTHAWRDHHRA